MREILFRGKRLDNGEWIEGNLFYPDTDNYPTQILLGNNIATFTYNVDPDTVSEFTGLHDKNGKHVFEGDIIKIKGGFKDFQWQISGVYGCKHRLESTDSDRFEVIGNKWDNPELLEGDNANKR